MATTTQIKFLGFDCQVESYSTKAEDINRSGYTGTGRATVAKLMLTYVDSTGKNGRACLFIKEGVGDTVEKVLEALSSENYQEYAAGPRSFSIYPKSDGSSELLIAMAKRAATNTKPDVREMVKAFAATDLKALADF